MSSENNQNENNNNIEEQKEEIKMNETQKSKILTKEEEKKINLSDDKFIFELIIPKIFSKLEKSKELNSIFKIFSCLT